MVLFAQPGFFSVCDSSPLCGRTCFLNMADGKNGAKEDDGKKSPPTKRTRSKTTKKLNPVHDISSENSENEGDGEHLRGSSSNVSLNQSDQMEKFASIISAAMGTALASVTQTLT